MVFDRQTQLGLIRGMINEPDDEAPALVYADWLEEQGDPLGELLRAQLELARPWLLSRDRRAELQARERQLLDGLGFDRPARSSGDANKDAVPPTAQDWSYAIERGLATLHIHQLPPRADALALPPPDWVERFGWFHICVASPDPDDYQFSINEKGIRAVLASPLLMERCTGLDLSSLFASNTVAQRLAASPAVAGLLWLNLRNNRLDHRALIALAESRHLSNLLDLEISQNPLEDKGVRALAESGAMPRLRRLRLFEVGATANGMKSLVRSTGFPELRSLDVSCNGFSAKAAEALAESSSFPHLRALGLAHAMIDDAKAQILAGASKLEPLEELDVSNSPGLRDAGVAALARSPNLPRLESLSLIETRLGIAGLEALCETDRFFRRGDLRLWRCHGCTDEALAVLARCPHAARLHSLTVGAAPGVSEAGARELASSPHLKGLRRLDLSMCKIGGEGVEVLTDPAAFPVLEELDLGWNPMGDRGALALARWCHERGQSKLDLVEAGVTAKGVAALVASGYLAGLRELDVGANHDIGDEGLRILAASPDLAGLRGLSVYEVEMTDEGALALAASPYLSADLELNAFDHLDLSAEAIAALEQRFRKVWH